MTCFYIVGPGHIFGADDIHFKFGVQIDCNEYHHMRVKIPHYEGAFRVM